MAERKILSDRYKNFRANRTGRSVTGKRGVIELHHESIFPGFKGGRKKYNDFGILELEKEEHTDRHTYGLKWWESTGLDPRQLVLEGLLEYRDTLSPFSFLKLKKGENDYETELQLVEEHIGLIQDMLVD